MPEPQLMGIKSYSDAFLKDLQGIEPGREATEDNPCSCPCPELKALDKDTQTHI